jgi:hypothetical protein
MSASDEQTFDAPAIHITGVLEDIIYVDCVFDAFSPKDLVYPTYWELLNTKQAYLGDIN